MNVAVATLSAMVPTRMARTILEEYLHNLNMIMIILVTFLFLNFYSNCWSIFLSHVVMEVLVRHYEAL